MKKEVPVEKNQNLQVTIHDLTYEGLGVAKRDGYPIFVENALPDEVVDIKVIKAGKNFGFGKVLKLVKESSQRVATTDNRLLQTGIAPLQHLNYSGQLAFKRQQVQNVLQKIAKLPEVPVLPTLGSAKQTGYRNKAQIPVRLVEDHLTTGFFRKNSHQLISMEDFYIQDPVIDQAVITIRDILRDFGISAYNEENHTGFLRHIIVRRGYYSHEMMVTLVTRKEKFFDGPKIAQRIHEALPEVVSVMQNVNHEVTNVILGSHNIVLWGQSYYEDQLLGNTYRISAPSFYQVNTPQAELLYQTAIDFAQLTKDDVVVDAYCGIGTIGLSLAKRVQQVYGVEVVPEAVADAKENAKLNKVTNISYEIGNAEDVMATWQASGVKPTVVMVDPPRKGLSESFIDATVAMAPEKVVYISCNPATLARDLALFNASGYNIEKVQPVDLFPQTVHVESVTLLTRREK
ncbi:23S rRNA (uracil(1939)-C(5))-methyltransferase RlmD [Enterococcus nangangensis]|uniref:23S rRNA (uracil(1939)-C(5))-methyltransferase RlmD n=1 Tax=Enterococcus nangangensis TaxID=2559926 RepID=UPI0010F689DC|nr:23S rRNA (uracil(1939)-C(5))-methyltransferase RlmD [Enterococcus nangangensis]